jgi:hypothetical protein
MKYEKAANKKYSMTRLFKTVLSLVMVFSLLMSCGLIFAGCGQNSNDESTGKPNDDQNNTSKYEGLTEEEYLQALESDNLEAAIEALSEVYGSFLEGMGSSSPADITSGAKMGLTLRLGDALLDMLEQAIFAGDIGDMSFLSKIDLNMDVSIKDQLEKVQLGLNLNGQKIMTLNLLMGLSDYVMYMAIPELSDTYLKFDLGKMMGDVSMTDMMSSAAQMSAFAKALPNAEVLTSVLERYLNLMLAELDNVTQSTAQLEVNGLKQDCTQLTLKIYHADTLAIAKSVFNAAKDDADLKKIIEDVAAAVKDLTGEQIDAAQVYAQFKQNIEDLLTELNKFEEIDTENAIELITYVDKDHNIIGRKLSMPDQDDTRGGAYYYYTVTEGDNFAFEAAVNGEYIKVSGTGTDKDGKISGNFTLSVEGTAYVTVNLDALSAESGTITLTPTAEAENALELDELPFKKLELQIKLGGGMELNVLSEGKLLAGLALKVEESDGPDLSIPSDATDGADGNALQKWAQKLVLDKVLKNLEDAGVPSTLTNALKNGLFGGAQSDTGTTVQQNAYFQAA